jgi:epoxyqueuosine reductase
MSPTNDLQQPTEEVRALVRNIKAAGLACGFQHVGIASLELDDDARYFARWLALGRHGEMHYMHRHGTKRTRPAELVPGTLSVISVRLDYWPGGAAPAAEVLEDPSRAYIARYALGRDYHKVMRKLLRRFAAAVATEIGAFGHRVFVDSAPVLEKALARNAGLGWIGKHTNLIDRNTGSWFFLGELYTDLQLPPDARATAHCGSCTACLDVCPTQAIVAPYELDARRCIAYLTIEHKGSIPETLRPALGNRIFGCDDCQLVCPWNKYARASRESDFSPRHNLDTAGLLELFAWSEHEWSERTKGSALRRTGYDGWMRNVAIGLGNAPKAREIAHALAARLTSAAPMPGEHIRWALQRHADGTR